MISLSSLNWGTLLHVGMPVVIGADFGQLCKVLCHTSGVDAASTVSKVQTNCNCKSGNREKCSQVPSGVIYFVALASPILCLFLLRHPLILFSPPFFHLPVILTTSRNHENKPKNPAIQKRGQGLVVL